MEGLLLTLSWLFDNGMNFVPHLFVALLIGLGIAVRANSGPWMIALVAAVGIAWGAMAISSFNHAPLQKAQPAARGTPIKTLTFNLHDRNRKYEEAVDYIWDAGADVVCLQEAVGDWRGAIASLLRVYPHALQSAKGGTILLSKRPLKVLDVNLGHATPYAIGVTVQELGRPVDLICLQLTRPDSPVKLAMRNQELGHLARTVFQSENPVVLLGDFNASTRSPAMFRFLQQTGLKTAGPGFPPANSWPGGMAFFGIRIDHVAYSAPLRQFRQKVGPRLGSNHRPVEADLFLPEPESPESIETGE